MDGEIRINKYLEGNFAPVRQEDDFDLPVSGTLPPQLTGTLYRNGPNPQFEPREGFYHWFAGDGMIHAFTVADGKVRYRNRYVRTPRWETEHAAGQSMYGAMGNPMTTDPSVMGTDSGVANTNIVWHGQRLLALEEAHAPFEIDPVTLEPKGYGDFGGKVTAHPKTDPKTGEMVFFAYGDDPTPLSAKVTYGVADRTGKVTRRETFEAPYGAMMHDFAVTDHYALLPLMPLTGSLERAMQGKPPYAWEPDKGARVGIISRDAGLASLRWFSIKPGYVFHVMNAWEDGQVIHADVMLYPRPPLFPDPDGTPGPKVAATLTRWSFDLAGTDDVATEAPLDDLAGEFPRFDERLAGQAYRHGWFAGQRHDPGGLLSDCIAHVDVQTGQRSVWELPERGDGVLEPVFVPRSPDAAEGDGWIVTVSYSVATNRSAFVVLDALNIAAGPIATAELPRRVPFGFHGNWIPG